MNSDPLALIKLRLGLVARLLQSEDGAPKPKIERVHALIVKLCQPMLAGLGVNEVAVLLD